MPPSIRHLNFIAGLCCAGALGYAYYAQFVLYLDPCPLCIVQRVAFLLLALTFFLAVWRPGRAAALGIGLVAASGALVAGRHVWLQSLPADQVPACGPSLDYMMRVFPVGDTLKMLFTGSGQCADVDWTLLGLSMPAWSLICLICLGVVGSLLNWRGGARR